MGVGEGYGHWEEEEETGNGKRGSRVPRKLDSLRVYT